MSNKSSEQICDSDCPFDLGEGHRVKDHPRLPLEAEAQSSERICPECGHEAKWRDPEREGGSDGRCYFPIGPNLSGGQRSCYHRCPTTTEAEAQSIAEPELLPCPRQGCAERDTEPEFSNGKVQCPRCWFSAPLASWQAVRSPATEQYKYSGDLWLDLDGTANFKWHIKGGDFLEARNVLIKFISCLQSRLDGEKQCPMYR